MFKSLEDFQKFGKDNFGTASESYDSLAKGLQSLATESVDFARKSFEASAAAFEKLVGAKSLDKAIEVQTDFARASYEAYVAQASKVGAAFTNLAKDSAKPFEGVLSRSVK